MLIKCQTPCEMEQILHQESTYMNKIIILLLIGMAVTVMQASGSSVIEADLPVRKSCNLERLYKDMPQNILKRPIPSIWWMNSMVAVV